MSYPAAAHRWLLLVAVAAAGFAGCGAQPIGDLATSPTDGAPASTPASRPSPTDRGPADHDLQRDGSLVPKGLATGMSVGPSGTRGRQILGADIGWPQCPKGMGIRFKETLGAPMPTPAARFVIIGLTNGPSFTANPCLADQVVWARQHRLLAAAYAVASWPRPEQVDELGGKGPYGGSRLGRLRNVGYQAAAYTMTRMRSAGLPSPMVWLDVEPVPHYDWEGTPEEHAAVVEGNLRGYRDAGVRVGLYSTPAMYRRIVGRLRLGVPEWRAAGQTSMTEAVSRCGPDWSIAGGRGVFGQWVEDGRDRNVTCPGVDLVLTDYFHRFAGPA